ncbi:MAG: alternative ribosome rescue aminoacyl-tRNA hydrolase ArfB [Planctomycetota bacterium]
MDANTSGWIELAPGIRVRRERLVFTAARGGGPGGQHANTTDSRVVLHLRLADLVGARPDQLSRVRRAAGQRLSADDTLVMQCDAERSQHRNRELLLERLRELVTRAAPRPKRRRPTRPTRASVERRLESKSRQSSKKQRRRQPPDA